jgi:hypothetical protein
LWYSYNEETQYLTLVDRGDVVPAAVAEDRLLTLTADGRHRSWSLTDNEVGEVLGLDDSFNEERRQYHMGAVRADPAWTSLKGDGLRDRICSARLTGAEQLTQDELADPILSAIDKNDPVARNPCLRRGPLHWEFYTQGFERWMSWAKVRLPFSFATLASAR